MIFQYSPFFIPLLISAAITGALALISIKRRNDPIILYFIVLMSATTLWTFAYAVQISSADLGTNLMMIAIAYLGIMTVPVAWLLLILCYLGYVNLITLRNTLLLIIVPVVVILLVATNTWHHLIYTAFAPEAIDGVIIWNFLPGPLYWFALGYSYLLMVVTFLLIASRYLHSPAVYRRQILILLIAAGIPFLANILFVSQLNPFPGLNITPFSFMLAGLILALGLMRYQLFSMAPVTYPVIFTAIGDGIIVLDRNSRISEINPVAMKILMEDDTSPVGKIAGQVLPADLMAFLGQEGKPGESVRTTVITKKNGPSQELEITCRKITEESGTYCGRLVMIRDITEITHARNAVEMANRKLNLLSSITRHDMQNKLTALRTYLELAKDESDPATITSYIPQMEKITGVLQEELEFTRDYQDLGGTHPAWQDIRDLILKKADLLPTLHLSIQIDLPKGLEIYADPLLEKVFYNLIDNALRYGEETLSVLEISCREERNDLIITFADNGAGIPAEDKPLLFTKGFGKNTGLGLFLSREILSITGITITENGKPGSGARFEITVPEGAWQVSASG